MRLQREKALLERTLSKASTNRSPLMRLLRHLAPQRRLVLAAVICSLLNKLFDLAPPILIGLAVDVVLLKKQSVLAGFGLRTAGQQLWGCLLYTSPSPRDS